MTNFNAKAIVTLHIPQVDHSTSIDVSFYPLGAYCPTDQVLSRPEISLARYSMSSPRIAIPRQYGGPVHFGSTTPTRSQSELRMPRFFKRLFKFPQMDFEMAIWEMTSLIIAPKKVFKSIYYHVSCIPDIASDGLLITSMQKREYSLPTIMASAS